MAYGVCFNDDLYMQYKSIIMGKHHREPSPRLSYNRANDLLEVTL